MKFTPGSARHSVIILVLVASMAVVFSVVGTFGHRLGAAYNVPYGLILSLALISIGAYVSRVLAGQWGLLVHATISTGVAWFFAFTAHATSAVIVVGGSMFTTFFSLRAAYIWLYGVFIVQTMVCILPQRLFNIPVPHAAGLSPSAHARTSSEN